MCVSAVWLMDAGHGLTFIGDDIYYYATYVAHGFVPEPAHGLEYFLAPHNGHLQLVGKLVYRLLFEIAGTDYTVFRAVEVALVLLSAGLFFVLARRRVGPVAALIPSVLLLFLGYAYEPLLWPFDLHTLLALDFGLAALLTLERGDRRGDLATCALLVLSVATVELGLAFTTGAAVSVLMREDRRRRAWIFIVPLALFGVWWLWARHFDQANFALSNVHLIPIVLTNALAAVTGSIFGLNPTGEGISVYVTTVTAWGTVLAAFAVIGLVVRVRRGAVPDTLWVSLAVVLVYWLMIAMGARPPDSSRYIFVGVVMVLLVVADAIRGMKLTWQALAVAAVLAALAIAPNIEKLNDGVVPRRIDALNTRTEYAMLELARPHVAADYLAAADPKVAALGGGLIAGLPAGEYFRAAGEFGSLAFSLDEVRAQSLAERQIADATLVGALGISLRPALPPANPRSCPSSLDGTPTHPSFFLLPRAGSLLGSRSGRPLKVSIGRFGRGGPGVGIGRLEPDRWARLATPPDAAPDRWWAIVSGPIYVCPLRSGGAAVRR